jgi:predicted ATP-dependent serine protease
MQHDSKPRYACPRCATKMHDQFGNCPNCGFIGSMEHKDMYLQDTNAAGKPVIVDPPTVQQDTTKQKQTKTSGTTPRYTCPRCGARASKAYGRCPDHRSCGYVGPMQTSTVGKRRLK